MQVYKVFMKILRSKMGIAITYLAIFLFIGIYSANNSPNQGNFSENSAGIVVNDLDKSGASKALIDYLGKTNKMSEGAPSDREMLDGIYYNPSRYYLTIKEGFEQRLADGETDGILAHAAQDGSYYESLVGSKIDLYLTTAKAYIAAGNSAEDALSKAAEALEKKTEVNIISEKAEGFAQMEGYFKFIPYIFLSVFVFALCPVIMAMTKTDIKNRIFSSSISPKRFLLENALGALSFMAVVYLLVIILIPVFAFKTDITADMKIAWLNCLAFTVFCASLVLLISNLVSSEPLISLIGNIISLGMSFICGVFVPLQYLDGSVKTIAAFLPAYWYEILVSALAGTNGQVYSTSLAVKCILIQFLFAIALFAATLAVMKAREAKTTHNA
ncbi:MAG: ABC transporter permease [Ruminococcus sp.]|nr:ABC transporter permease [Ruminococcus sp.]